MPNKPHKARQAQKGARFSESDGRKKMGLDSVELLLSVEDHFNIEVPDRVAEKMNTVGDIHAFVVSELNRLGRSIVSPATVFEELRDIICTQFAVKPGLVEPEAQIVRDLRID